MVCLGLSPQTLSEISGTFLSDLAIWIPATLSNRNFKQFVLVGVTDRVEYCSLIASRRQESFNNVQYDKSLEVSIASHPCPEDRDSYSTVRCYGLPYAYVRSQIVRFVTFSQMVYRCTVQLVLQRGMGFRFPLTDRIASITIPNLDNSLLRVRNKARN